MRARSKALALAALALLAGSQAPGADVEIELEAALTWTDTPVTLQVKVNNPERGMGAPQLSPVPGLEIRGPSRPSQQQLSVNGRRSVCWVYGFELTPVGGKTGKLSIGPVTVQRDGGQPALQSSKVELIVSRKPPPGILVGCELRPETGPVGAPFKVIYTIYYSGELATDSGDFPAFFQRGNPLGLTGLDLPILGLSNARIKPIRVLENVDAMTVRIANDVEIQIQKSTAEKDAFGYLTLVFGFEILPFGTDPIQVGGAAAGMRLKTGGTEVRRNVFGDTMRVDKVSELKAVCPDTQYQVRALPEEGRPPGFTGAVGQYKISAKASPTEVDAFAPITVEARVSGNGFLDNLKPPAWTEIESLTRDFDVSTDVDSGKVENGAKVFRQVIRPRHERVTTIPPLPFPYFDPRVMKFQVALAEPIAIKVRAVKTIGGDEAIPSPRAVPEAGERPAVASAPAIVERSGIGANFSEIGDALPALDPRDEILSPPFLATVVAPPGILAGLALVLRARRKDPALRKKSKAFATATSKLTSSLDASGVAEVCEEYFRDRLGLPPGEVTPAELTAALERAQVPAAVRMEAARALENAHAAKFGGGGGAAGALAADAAAVLKEIEKCLRS